MIKILHVGKFFPINGGVEKVMFDIVESLSKNNDIVCDMLCASISRESQIININNASIICTGSWIKAYSTMISPSMIWKLKQMCSNYDIIHIHHPDPMAALALRLSGYKGKVVLHWHSDILKQKNMLRLYLPLQNWLINRACVIIGTTPKYLSFSSFLQNEKLNKICIPIGISPINYNIDKVHLLKEKYKNKRIIFSLGRLVEYKGYEYLIKAARFLSEDYIILIGGSGPLKTQLESLIYKYDLSKKVELLGRISEDELSSYYGACDIYVLSSIWKTEAFGIVQIEAMSCGKPIIATKIDGSGVDWVNNDGVSGINVEPMNSKAIADAILYIFSNKMIYEKLSQGAYNRYVTYFRKEVMIGKIKELYNSLIE